MRKVKYHAVSCLGSQSTAVHRIRQPTACKRHTQPDISLRASLYHHHILLMQHISTCWEYATHSTPHGTTSVLWWHQILSTCLNQTCKLRKMVASWCQRQPRVQCITLPQTIQHAYAE